MASREAREARLLQIGALLRSGVTQADCAKRLGISRMTVSRLKDEALAALDGKRPVVKSDPGVKAKVEAARAAGPVVVDLGSELEKLVSQSAAGADVAPQLSLLMARECQRRLVDSLSKNELGPKEVADSLAKLETVRKSAESALEIRSTIKAEMAEFLLAVVDRVAPEAVYQAVVSELEGLS